MASSIKFLHCTGFPARRVYKVENTNKQAQIEAQKFVDKLQGVCLRDTRNRIKYILL